MLGKGLESLIPKNNNQGQQAAALSRRNRRSHNRNPSRNPSRTRVLFRRCSRFRNPCNPLFSQWHNPPHSPSPSRSLSPKSATILRRNPSIISRSKRSRRTRTSRAGILTRMRLHELASSIREFGFLQPLVVSKVEKETPTGIAVEYQIIAGERRFMAAKLLGLPRVPAIIRNINLEREKLELGVIENIQRENLNPIEMARAFQRLQEEFRMTQREIAAKLGKSREVVANSVRLLDLPEYIQRAVEEGSVSESNARILIGDRGSGRAKKVAWRISFRTS